jgi:hypothetical protein
MIDVGPGTRVRCIKQGSWVYTTGNPSPGGPKYGEICVVQHADDYGDGEGMFFWLYGHDGRYQAIQFVPLEPDIEVFRSILTEIRDPDLVKKRVTEDA